METLEDTSGNHLQYLQFQTSILEIEKLLYTINKDYYDTLVFNEDKFKWLLSLLMIFPLSDNETIIKVRKDLTLLCLVFYPKFYKENYFSQEDLLKINFLKENLYLINKAIFENTVYEPYIIGMDYTFNPDEQLNIVRDNLTSLLESKIVKKTINLI